MIGPCAAYFRRVRRIKPFYAIGALDSKVITPDYKIHDTGIFMLPGVSHVYHDHGWQKTAAMALSTWSGNYRFLRYFFL